MLLIDVPREGDLLGAMHAVVARVVALGSGGVGEYHAATGHEGGVGVHEVGTDGVAHGACLHVGATDVDNVDVALMGGDDATPFGKKGLHGGRGGVEAQVVGIVEDEFVLSGNLYRPRLGGAPDGKEQEGCKQGKVFFHRLCYSLLF